VVLILKDSSLDEETKVRPHNLTRKCVVEVMGTSELRDGSY